MDDPRQLPLPASDPGQWRARPSLTALLVAALLVGGTIMLGIALGHVLPASSMPLLFLLAVLLASVRYGFWTGIFASILAFLAENFFFIEPHYTFHVGAVADWLSLAALLVAGATTGFLVGRLREEADAARARAHSLLVMGQFAAGLAQAASMKGVLALLVTALQQLEGGKAVALAWNGSALTPLAGMEEGDELASEDIEAVERVLRRGGVAGAAAPGWIGGDFTFHALGEGGAVIGYRAGMVTRPEFDKARAALIDQAQLALRNLALVDEAAEARDMAERETLRSALLSSLSHDLRTPLATILGGISSLRELGGAMPAEARQDTLLAVEEEAGRLSRYVDNLLHLTRLKAGLDLRLDWVDGADIVHGAVRRARRNAPSRLVRVEIAEHVPLIHTDAVLLEQALFNLIDNALKFSPQESPVRVMLGAGGQGVTLAVADQGPGIPEAEQAQVFEPFFRGEGKTESGTGLGLAITGGIVQALGGQLALVSPVSDGRGTMVRITLPVQGGTA